MNSLRERNMARRRQQILDAARGIIAEQGYDGLSMRKLAERAGLALKTLYNLYGSRGAILNALVGQAMDRMDQALDQSAPVETEPLLRCREIVTVSVAHLLQDEVLARSMVLAQYRGPQQDFVDDGSLNSRPVGMQAAALRSAMAHGLVRGEMDAELLAAQIFQLYKMAFVHWAYRRIDGDTFRDRALYGLYVVLLGAVTDKVRPLIEAELSALQKRLRTAKTIAAA